MSLQPTHAPDRDGQYLCPICDKPVKLETAKTDEDGHVIHEECYFDDSVIENHWGDSALSAIREKENVNHVILHYNYSRMNKALIF
jgi:hypothetical protein